MKFLKKSIYALSLVSMMGLWSCSQEEMLLDDVAADAVKGHPVQLTLTVNRGDAQTRTVIKENNVGGLDDTWESGDKLHVYNSNGEDIGTLTITDGVGTSVGVFYGEVKATEGEQDLSLWYYDEDYMESESKTSSPKMKFSTYKYSNDATVPSLYLDLRSQNFASEEEFKKVDVLSKKVTLNVNGEKSTVVNDEVLKAYLTFARFSLKNIPTGTKGTLDIYDIAAYGSNVNTGEEYYNTKNQWSFDLGQSCVANRHTDKTNIVVDNVEVGKDVYVAFVSSPDTEKGKTPSKGYQLGFIFTATNGDVYTYEFDKETVLWAGKYYNNGVGTDGKVKGTELFMEKKEEVVDHSKNPLAKWAESDLKRSGTGVNVTGVFTGSYSITGSYYQFGRNYGYNTIREAKSDYCYDHSDMPNGRDAYRGDGTSKPVQYYDATVFTNYKSYPNTFFIATALDGDYRTPARQDTWEERAIKNGYTHDSPCPVGWRLPTVAEYKEILPLVDNKAGYNIWANLSQFKTLSDKTTRCAFRWSTVNSSGTKYLKIDCLVVGSKESDINTINWSDSNVVTRYFKCAGYFQAIRHLWQSSVNYNTTQYVALPAEWSNIYYQAYSWSNLIYAEEIANYMSYGGFYWASDAVQGVFTIVNNTSTGYTGGYYLTAYTSPIACNIRCVKE